MNRAIRWPAQADDSLLLRLAVRVLKKDGKELQRVTMCLRRTAKLGIDRVQLFP